MPNQASSSSSGLTNIVNPISLLQAQSTPKSEKKKWLSKDNLISSSSLTSQVQEPSTLYVAMYDYVVNLDKHLNLHKDDRVYVLSYNKTQEWCEVQNSQTGQIGWVRINTSLSSSSLLLLLILHNLLTCLVCFDRCRLRTSNR